MPVLWRLLQALARHDGGGPVASVESLAAQGFGARRLYWAQLAERDGVAMGMIIHFPEYSTHSGRVGVYVQDLYVSPEARGLGVGRWLLQAAIAAQEGGAEFVSLGVSPDNAVAQGFYRTLGFRARGYEMMLLDGPALAALR